MPDITDSAFETARLETDEAILWIDDPVTGQATPFHPLDIFRDVIFGEPGPFDGL